MYRDKLIKRLENKESITLRDFKRCIGEDLYQEYLNELEFYKELKQHPKEIKEYIRRFKQVNIANTRSENYSLKKIGRKINVMERLRNESDKLTNLLIEYLNEILQTQPILEMYFDEVKSEIINFEDLPKIQRNIPTKREIKLRILKTPDIKNKSVSEQTNLRRRKEINTEGFKF